MIKRMKMDKKGAFNFLWVVLIIVILGLAFAGWNHYGGVQMAPGDCQANPALSTWEKTSCAGGSATAGAKLNIYCSSKSSSQANCISKRVGDKTCCVWKPAAPTNTATIVEGETKILSYNGINYAVSIVYISTSVVKLKIGNTITPELSEGNSYVIASGVVLVVDDIIARQTTGVSDSVVVRIAPGYWTCSDSDGGKNYNVKGAIDYKETDSQGTIIWTGNPSDWCVDAIINGVMKYGVLREYYCDSSNQVGFEHYECPNGCLDGACVQAPAGGNLETTIIFDRYDAVTIKTEVKDGALELPILAANSYFTAFSNLGQDTDSVLVTSSTGGASTTVNLNELEDSYFVVTWIKGTEAESYAYELKSITSNSGKNETTLDNLAAGGSDITFSEVGKTRDVAHITFTLVAADDAKGTATIKAIPNYGGSVYSNLLVTKRGMQIRLPVVSSRSGNGNINFATKPTQHTITFTEESASGNIGTGKSFSVVVGLDTANSGTEPKSVGGVILSATSDPNVKVGYVQSSIATKVTFTNIPTGLNEVKIEYP